jgi:methyl-accepting chemotaxis protein
MEEGRVEQARRLSEAATTTFVQIRRDGVERGESVEAATKAGLDVVRRMRYDKTNYVFIYDRDGTGIMIPPKPEREGKNFLADKDPNGVPYIKLLSEAAAAGGGAVRYSFSKPGREADGNIPKISYSMSVPDTTWFLGTGAYSDDIQDEFRSSAIGFLALSTATVIISVLIAAFLAGRISGPILRLREVATRLADEELSVEVLGTDKGDEIGDLARSMRILRDHARGGRGQGATSRRSSQGRGGKERDRIETRRRDR